jgi:hypothetical protein
VLPVELPSRPNCRSPLYAQTEVSVYTVAVHDEVEIKREILGWRRADVLYKLWD